MQYYCIKSRVARYCQPSFNKSIIKAIHVLLMHGFAVLRISIPGHKSFRQHQCIFMIQNGKWFSNAECICVVCAEVLRHSQQLRSCRASQLPINTVPRQASTYYAVNQYLASKPPVVSDNYRRVITADTTIFQYVQPSPKIWGIRKGR